MNAIWIVLMCLQDPAEKPKPPAQEKEVVVIGQRRESDVLDVPSGVSVVTAKQIEEAGATNIVEIIQRQPGFFAQGQNKTAADQVVDLRGYNNGGGNGQRTLVLVDGRKTNSVVGSSTDWASIPLENIERIEIVRGPAAALYGDGALAGVINVITKKGGKEIGGGLSGGGGSWGTMSASANAGGTFGRSSVDLTGVSAVTQGWRDNSAYSAVDFTGRVEVPFSTTIQGSFKAGHHQDTRERPGTLTKAQIDSLGSRASVTPGDKGSLDQSYIDAGMSWDFGSGGELSLFTNYSYASESSFFAAFGGFESADVAQIAMAQLKHVLHSQWDSVEMTFTSGVDLSFEVAHGESGSVGSPKDQSDYGRRLIGLYEHLEVRPAPWLLLSGGIRWDRALLDLDRDSDPFNASPVDTQRAFDALSPQLGVTFRPLEELSVYASWGRTFRYPTRDELIGFFLSQPQLEPERAKSMELGVRGQAGRFASGSVGVFRMDVRDEIFFDTSVVFSSPFGPLTGSNANFERVVHQGIEAEARVSPCSFIELFGMWTYTRAVIEESANPVQEGKRYPVTPRFAASGGITARYENAMVTLSGRYAGERLLINDFSNTLDSLPAYLVFDLKVSYSWKSASAFFSIFNFSDREYLDSGGVSIFGGSPRYSPAPARSTLFGLDLRF